MPSLKKNFFYSSFLTVANYIFPLLTFPYVTRVLGVENIGICNFVDSIINYFILISTMGIGTVGLREIAANRAESAKLSKTFSSLIALNSIFTIGAIILLAIATIFVKELYEYKELMIFGGFKLIFSLISIEWFYKGLEDFRYITIRTLIVKCLYVASVFIFVRKANDYPLYYLLTVLMTGVNGVINIFHSRKFTKISGTGLEIKRYIKPFLTLGIYMILTSMYTTFNVMYLGFVSDTTQVGYYSTATKLYSVIIALFSAFTGVMLPRMTSLLSEGKIDQFKNLYLKSVDILVSISVPAVIYTIIFAPQIVLLIAGEGYAGSVVPMQIVMPMLLIIGYEQILVIQALMPLKKDSIILRNSIVGAVLGVLLNIAIVGKLQAVGSSIVWVTCELTILILSQIAITKITGLQFPFVRILKSLLVFSPIILTYLLNYMEVENYIYQLLISFAITLLYFIIIQLTIFKDGIVADYIRRFTRLTQRHELKY